MRLAGLVIGPNDIARETRMRMVPGRAPMVPALMSCVFAARAHGLDILDGVYNNFSDTEGFARECAQAREMGFDGKTLIHPSQIEPCNAAFTPEADDVAAAREILAEFAKPENAGRGAIQIKGQMVERLHQEMAHGGRWRSPTPSRRWRPGDHADVLLCAGHKLDGAAHRAARDRRAVRIASAVVRDQRAARRAVSRRSIPKERCRRC